jgi:hypothetical protein
MSFNYPVEPTPAQQEQYRTFVLQLQHVLPCGKCRNNLESNLANHPLTMDHMASRDTFSRYIYELHEVVNTMLHKKSHLSFEDVRERYEHFRARCAVEKPPAAEPSSIWSTFVVPKENGCVTPMEASSKSKCIMHIVPYETHEDEASLQIDARPRKTIKRRKAKR